MNRMMRSIHGKAIWGLFYEQANRKNTKKLNISKDPVRAVPYRSDPIPVTVDR